MTVRRVVITGMGAVSSLGVGADAAWRGMVEARSGIAPYTTLPVDQLRAKIGGEARDFDPARHFDDKRVQLIDRFTQFALVAAREAVAQSGLDFRADGLGSRSACIVGTGIGGEMTHDEASQRLYRENSPRLHPLTIVRLIPNAATSMVCTEFGVTGPSFAVSSACASANHALAQAFQMVRTGLVDAALAGGSEACLSFGTAKAWEAMRVLADDACRPFCKQRRGLVLAEGSGMYVLEDYERARARGAAILAEFAGAGMTSDASDLVLPTVDGPAGAIAAALRDAGLAPADIGYINAHGTGTPANDPTETQAIRRVFGAHADALAVSSTKAVHGHALGAAGAIELVAAIGALREGVIPPTANFLDPDPACDLDYVPNTAREKPVRAVLSHSFAFGGLNAVVALRRAP